MPCSVQSGFIQFGQLFGQLNSLVSAKTRILFKYNYYFYNKEVIIQEGINNSKNSVDTAYSRLQQNWQPPPPAGRFSDSQILGLWGTGDIAGRPGRVRNGCAGLRNPPNTR